MILNDIYGIYRVEYEYIGYFKENLDDFDISQNNEHLMKCSQASSGKYIKKDFFEDIAYLKWCNKFSENCNFFGK